MKRDWDLIRTILEQVESLPDTDSVLSPSGDEDHTAEEEAYQYQLLIDAGLAKGVIFESSGGPLHGQLFSLTWQGHELLDAIRNDTIWNDVKKTAKQKGLGLTFDLIGTLAKSAILGLLAP